MAKQFPRDYDPMLIAAETAWQEKDYKEYNRLVLRWYKENNYSWNGVAWTRA